MSDKVDFFCMLISVKTCCKLILWFWWGLSNIIKVLKVASLQCLYNISKKEVRDEIDFLHVDKHQSSLKNDFNTGLQSFLPDDAIIIDELDPFSKYSK